jgi:hypothetical protein
MPAAELATLEQHQPDWSSPADKVARTEDEIERADFSSQPGNAPARNGTNGLCKIEKANGREATWIIR